MKQYKYLVVCGCSLSYGLDCPIEQTYPYLLANRLGLKLINLSTPGIGWITLQSTVMSFIDNNRDIVDECFFILQKSLLGRELHYEIPLPTCRTDIWEKWNIKFTTVGTVKYHGFIDWDTHQPNRKPDWWDIIPSQNRRAWADNNIWGMLPIIPEHNYGIKHLSHMIPSLESIPYIHDQFEQVMLYWAMKISSFHFLLKELDIDHIIVDGYTPTVSHKLNFVNYDEYFYKLGKQFWSQDYDGSESLKYDFKNIKAGWIFDKIDIKYKIDDVVLWGLFKFRKDKLWNLDGAHAGPLGMKLIEEVLYKNLISKGWIV